jgi:hypothetical protein
MRRLPRSTACTEFFTGPFCRRHLLRIGGLSLLGAQLGGKASADQSNATLKVRAKSVILLHQWGGPSHHDTIDMKPKAPAEIRGEFRAAPTSAPEIMISDRLPRLAKVAHHCSLIRSMTHTMKNHNSAGYYSLTGFAPATDDQRLRDSLDLFPAYGSVVDRLAPAEAGMPTFVGYPYTIRDGSITPGQHASFLGKQHDPLFFTNDPNGPDFRLPELSLPGSLSLERLEHRQSVMKLIDQQSELLEFSATARGLDAQYRKAVRMLTSAAVQQAFDLAHEPAALRDRYGRTTYGQGCLLARRLVEAGVRFVNVYFSNSIGGQSTVSGGWDTHGFNNKAMYPILKDYLLPMTDQTLPTLLEDLAQRGLLETTLVVWMGEFGRSPRINANAGRDHWPQCYSVLLAGGGVKGGFVFGASDKNGAYPARDPVRPEDLAATLFYLLGLDPQAEIHDALNRPLPIARGYPLLGLIA